jgi:hypothetical protein
VTHVAQAVLKRRHLVEQELRREAFADRPFPGLALGIHESCQTAVALLFGKKRPMLLATEVAQRQLSKNCQFMAANQAVHACPSPFKYPVKVATIDSSEVIT